MSQAAITEIAQQIYMLLASMSDNHRQPTFSVGPIGPKASHCPHEKMLRMTVSVEDSRTILMKSGTVENLQEESLLGRVTCWLLPLLEYDHTRLELCSIAHSGDNCCT